MTSYSIKPLILCLILIGLSCDRDTQLRQDADWTVEQVARIKTSGNEIVAQLEMFHQAHGKYPRSMKELLPFDVQPPAVKSKGWMYFSRDGSKFFLSIESQSNPSLVLNYRCDLHSWELMDM